MIENQSFSENSLKSDCNNLLYLATESYLYIYDIKRGLKKKNLLKSYSNLIKLLIFIQFIFI